MSTQNAPVLQDPVQFKNILRNSLIFFIRKIIIHKNKR